MSVRLVILFVLFWGTTAVGVCSAQTEQQLARWLKRFPDADANGDGKLTLEEARQFQRNRTRGGGRGVPRVFKVDEGWNAERFPEDAVCYRSPDEIAEIYASLAGARGSVTRYDKPRDGSLRIVGTGHSFMAPGYKTFPKIAQAAGLQQPPLLTHTGGGITGSARYKWEQENGIFQFDGKPQPRLLASIANASWDAMMWGPYYQDRPVYYSCWIDFCLKYNPNMKFYLSDAWPQLGQLSEQPTSAQELTPALFKRLGEEKNEANGALIRELNEDYPGKVFIMPTSDAMVLAVQYFHDKRLPGVEGVHKVVGGKERSLWRDQLGHLGPGLGQLEGYVFYATLYGRSPELIEGEIKFANTGGYPGTSLDRVFREIAWKAVTNNPYSGVVDKDGDGLRDESE